MKYNMKIGIIFISLGTTKTLTRAEQRSVEEDEYDCEKDGLLHWHRKTTGFPDDYEAEHTDTWQECQKICAKIEACKGFTWHKENSAYQKSCSLFSEYGWKGLSNTTVSGPKECPTVAKEISIQTGTREDATKTDGDVFATIIETTEKNCMTALLTNDKGVDRSSPGKLDLYSSETRLGSCFETEFSPEATFNITLTVLEEESSSEDDWFVDWIRIRTKPGTDFQYHCPMQAWLGSQQAPTRAGDIRKPSQTASCCQYPGPCQPQTTDAPGSASSSSNDHDSSTEPEKNTNTTDGDLTTIAIASSAFLFVMLVFCGVVTILFFMQKNKKAKKTEERLDEDLNPVYGVYYASSGDRMDDGVHEIIDENEYYAT